VIMIKQFILVGCLVALCCLGCDRLLPFFEPGADGTGGVFLYTDRSAYSPADTVLITLHNDTGDPVYLDGCSAFSIAVRGDSGWTISPLRICVWEGFGQKIPAGGKYQETLPPGVYSGTLKIYARVHWACEDGKPISQAECQRTEERWSKEFTISK
jgi:hypothetical protein